MALNQLQLNVKGAMSWTVYLKQLGEGGVVIHNIYFLIFLSCNQPSLFLAYYW